MIWTFEIRPTELDIIYWSHTLKEIQDYARLRLSWFQAQASQQYQVMRIIMEQAFGSSKTGDDPNVTKLEPKSNDEAKSMLAGMFKK